MRKKDEKLQGVLLDFARELIEKQGPDAVNIRTIAQMAGIAVGTVYNYFPSKDDILLALTEDYWRTSLAEMRAVITAPTFLGQIEEIYLFLRESVDRSAGVLMHSLSNVEGIGRERMEAMQTKLGEALVERMEHDSAIRNDIWTESFSKPLYARFVLMNMMMLLRSGTADIGFFLEIIKRTLYEA